VTNGFFNVIGTQTGTPGGGFSQLGPFAIDFGAEVAVASYTFNGSITIAVPATSLGVWIIPTPTITTLSARTVLGDTGITISPVSPSYLNWTNAAVPSNLYLVSGSSLAVTVHFV
jgi:hypothetical protein